MENNSQQKNKKIIQNTMFMYIRMIVFLVISLFTARIVFNTLGIDNYGIYNLVAGIIVFFTFLNNGLASATKRYITTEIGNGTKESTQHVFNICILAHLIIAGLILVLTETIGLWIVNNLLNIPSDRIYAANWVYQLSIVSAILGIVQSPFGAVIVAYERMNVYAYFTIFDVIFKLAIIYFVQILSGDKLIIYAWLVFGLGIVSMIMYRIYTFYEFPICRLKFRNDSKMLKEIFQFMSWSIMGQAAVVGTNQGVNTLINIYYNVAVNAAMGISNTITGIVNSFVGNFQIAFNPQIIKSFAAKDYEYLTQLIYRASKISSFLVIIFLTPLLFETHNVLALWLGDYPEYAVEFAILTLICVYFEAVSAPLWMLVYSHNEIKRYQIIISFIYSMNLLFGWGCLLMDFLPYSVIIVRIIIFFLLLIIRLIYANRLVSQINIGEWMWQILGKGVLIVFCTSLVLWRIVEFIHYSLFLNIVIVTSVSLVCQLPFIYWLGLNTSERAFLKRMIANRI